MCSAVDRATPKHMPSAMPSEPQSSFFRLFLFVVSGSDKEDRQQEPQGDPRQRSAHEIIDLVHCVFILNSSP